MPDQNTPLVITRQVLKELEEIAVVNPIPEQSLNYAEFQQIIVIRALAKWIESYAITPQFEIKID